MANNEFAILIKTWLDQSNESVKDLNAQIKKLQEKVQALDIKINIDKEALSGLENLIKIYNDNASRINKDLNQVIKENIKIIKEADGVVKKYIEQHLKNGEIIQKEITEIDKKNEALERQSIALEEIISQEHKLIKARTRYNADGTISGRTETYRKGLLDTVVNFDDNGDIKSFYEIENLAKEKLRKQLIDLAITGKYTTEELRKVGKALTFAKTTDDIDRVQLKLDNLKLSVRKLSQEPATINIKGEQFGQLDTLINTRLTREHVKDIINLSDAYRNLQIIESSVDQTTGKWTATLRLNSKEQLVLKGQVDAATGSIYKQGEAIKQASAKNLGTIQQLAIAMKRIPVWMIGMTSFYFPIRQFQQGLQYIHELDTAMTNLRKVTDETSESYREFEIEANKIANTLATTTVDVINSTTEWARLGYSLKQATALAKEAIIYANVGDMGIEEANQALISAIKGFGIQVDEEGKNVRKIVDLYNEVGNKFAISSEGIGSALQRSASSLASAGNTIEESVALITAANTVIQNPERVGNGLKTVAMRIRGISEEGEDLTNLVPTLEKQFNALGLTLKKDDNTFKSTYEIFKDLSSVWNNITDFQRANILELVAGKHQGNVIDSLIRNFKDAENALVTGLNSAGSATKEYENYLNSIDAKLATLKNTAIGFWQTSLNTEGIKNVIESATHLVDMLTKVVDTLGFIPTLSTIVGTSFIALSTKARTAAISFLGLDKAIQGTTLSLRILKGTLASLGIGAIIFGVSLAIDALTSALAKNAEKQKEIKRTNDQAVESWSKNKSEIQSLVAEYETLSKKTSLSSEEQERLTEVQNKLNQLMPIFTDHVDEQGNAHLRASEAIAKEIKYVQELKESYDKLTLAKFDKEVKELFNDIDDKLKEINKLKNKTGEVIVSPSAPGGVSLPVFIPESEEDAILRQREVIQNERELAVLYDQIADLVNKKVDAYLSVESATKNLTETDKEYLKTQTDLFKETITSKDELLSFSNSLTNVAVNISKVKNALNAGTYSGLVQTSSDLQKSLMEIGYSAAEANKEVERLIKQFSSSEMEQGKDNVFDLAKYQSELKESLSNYSDSVKDLASAYATLNDGEELSLDTIIGLINKYPELITHLVNENGQLKLNKDAILLLAKAKEEEFKYSIRIKEQELQAEANALTQKLSLYGLEIKSLQDVAKARQEALKALGEYAGMGVGTQLFSDIDKIEEYYKTIEGYRALINSDLTKNLSGRSKSSSSKDNPQLKELEDSTDAFIRLQNAAANANKELANRIKDQIEMAKNQENYNDAISKTNDLLKTQRQIVDDLKYANQNINAQADKLRKNNSQYDTSKWFDRNAEATIAYYNQLNSLIEKRNRIEQSVKDKDSRAKQVEAIDKEINSIKQLFDQLQKLKKAYMDNVVSIHEMNSAIRETNSSLSELEFARIQQDLEGFKKVSDEIEYRLSVSKEIMGLYNETSVEYRQELEKQVKALNDKFNANQKEIDYLNQQLRSGKLTTKQYAELESQLNSLTIAQYNLANAIQDTQDALIRQLTNIFEANKKANIEYLQEQQKKIEESLNSQIDYWEDYYDSQIEKQEEILKNLDEQIEKEDRLKKLREIEDEMNKVYNDRRFSYITQDGQEILTYDKARYNELQKQRDDLLKQYQREDIKKAIQDEVDRLRKAKEDKINELRDEIKRTKLAYDQMISDAENYWDGLIKATEDGTLNFDTLMSGENGWYNRTVNQLKTFGANVAEEINKIASLFQSLGSISIPDISLPNIGAGSYASGDTSYSSPSTSDIIEQMKRNAAAWHNTSSKAEQDRLVKENEKLAEGQGWTRGSDGVWRDKNGKRVFHTGGIVGGKAPNKLIEIANQLFNEKPNEMTIKALRGELQIPPQNIARYFVPNLRNIAGLMTPKTQSVVTSGDTITLNNVTIKANNPMEFFEGLKTTINSHKK